MPQYPPEVTAYVEEIVYTVLDSLRKSQQVENRYHALTRQAKGATTVQLRELSKKVGAHILANVKDIEELGDLDSDALVHEALMRALPSND